MKTLLLFACCLAVLVLFLAFAWSVNDVYRHADLAALTRALLELTGLLTALYGAERTLDL